MTEKVLNEQRGRGGDNATAFEYFKALGLTTIGARSLALFEGIHTLEEASDYSAKELLRLPNFGRKSLDELRKAMEAEGLNLRGETRAERLKRARRKVREARNRLLNAESELAAVEAQ